MANPNLNTDGNKQSPAEKEFENNIRPSEISDFAGQPKR
jgi:holliday junction DNA helicase RuvB